MHKERFLKALEKRYDARREEAIATLSLYLDSNNLAAIGEHSDILDEQDKWLTVFVDANDKLDALKLVREIIQDSNSTGMIKS
jgi:hypothetical protein